ncbi:hypothetical protein [Nocardiopsis halophila]|uniref:hypothetical protein n=1 Tax=Nocardiopsis halophila TaxID=141692 RepID=UPI000477CE02|nr:hypothetical protein [Nocardiopsis halophila]
MTLPGADELFFRSSEPPAPEPAPDRAGGPPAPATGADDTVSGGSVRRSSTPQSSDPVAESVDAGRADVGGAGAGSAETGGADRDGGGQAAAEAPAGAPAAPKKAPRPSGRQRHDEKITVYISAPELLALEQARLTLRAEHGLAADRGRIVREAVAVLLADFDENGGESVLVRRLTG